MLKRIFHHLLNYYFKQQAYSKQIEYYSESNLILENKVLNIHHSSVMYHNCKL